METTRQARFRMNLISSVNLGVAPAAELIEGGDYELGEYECNLFNQIKQDHFEGAFYLIPDSGDVYVVNPIKNGLYSVSVINPGKKPSLAIFAECEFTDKPFVAESNADELHYFGRIHRSWMLTNHPMFWYGKGLNDLYPNIQDIVVLRDEVIYNIPENDLYLNGDTKIDIDVRTDNEFDAFYKDTRIVFKYLDMDEENVEIIRSLIPKKYNAMAKGNFIIAYDELTNRLAVHKIQQKAPLREPK